MTMQAVRVYEAVMVIGNARPHVTMVVIVPETGVVVMQAIVMNETKKRPVTMHLNVLDACVIAPVMSKSYAVPLDMPRMHIDMPRARRVTAAGMTNARMPRVAADAAVTAVNATTVPSAAVPSPAVSSAAVSSAAMSSTPVAAATVCNREGPRQQAQRHP